ncbi:MAG TPA: dethiobiotin synthase [Chitinophagales bacterium]|nr:dethiobiotin synthase [Chitinophagales bacterium]HMU70825.1 dethiobiotin synthase [Chitinophagales bacterium]HMX04865.1 dethiobiotin synthase [Chitinophagales bacterium]HMZ88099.1 dethiobiotin synthase [Chitinophagales bacterium]HNA57950.1 dethiobiotin synthase [Chitinophagales bacterium]
MKKIFITGIGTDIGKTVVSAVVVEALFADYWKPVQSGGLDYTDTQRVQNLISNPKSQFHKEAFLLKQPMSPHAAAALDGVEIDLDNIVVPETSNTLVIEGAGGLMVPINNSTLMLDMIAKWEASVIVVSKNYLGSINHTLLTCAVLRAKQIPVAGIIFNGMENVSSEQFITQYSDIPVIGRVAHTDVLDKPFIKKHAEFIRKRMQQLKIS